MAPADRKRLEKLLGSWRDSLIDLSFRNRLLSYLRRSTSVGMDITAPGLLSVIEALGRGCGFAEVRQAETDGDETASGPRTALVKTNAVTLPADSRPIDTPASRQGVGGRRPAVSLTTSKTSQVEQDRHLKRLATVTREKYNDYGLWVLNLGVGFLDWKPAPTAEKGLNSPLVMVPVLLERRGASYVLKLNANEEPVLNPALGIKMSELSIDWPRPDQVELGGIPELIDSVRRAVARHREWKVTTRIVLDTFNSSKEVMYRDLLENADRVMGSSLVRALGLGADSGLPAATFDFEPADIEHIDAVQPPEKAPMVLDADSSQRQCVAAALDGRSFVMDGPPGTGKSQTITNMIAGLLEQGRTVLFVSEKAAALDVVRNRLSDVGLGDYVLALHSNTAGRKQVAQELGRALAASRRTLSGGSQVELGRVRKLREELSAYASAMNDIRPGLGVSLHDALGRIALLDTADPLPASDTFDAGALSEQRLSDAENAALQVAVSWRPALEGTSFSWYGLKDSGNPLLALDMASEALSRLDSALTVHAALLSALGWDGPLAASRLAAVLQTAGRRPRVPREWLTADPESLRTEVRAFLERMNEVTAAERPAEQELGSAWHRLPLGVDSEPSAAETALSSLVPPPVDLASLTADDVRHLAQRLDSDADGLEQAGRSLAAVSRMYGLPEPETCEEALRLGRLAALAALPDEAKPQPSWLTAEGLADARRAAQALRESVHVLVTARQRAEAIFTEQVLGEQSLGEVAERFATVHRSLTGALSSARRADSRLVRSWLVGGGKVTKAVVGALPAAVAWQQAARGFGAETAAHASALGILWKGEDTDFALVDVLVSRAEEIAALAPRVLDRGLLTRELAAGGAPHPAAKRSADEAVARLTEWRNSLVLPPAAGPSYELETGSLLAAAAWSRAHVAPLRAAEPLIRVVEKTAAAGGGGHLAPGRWTLSASRIAVQRVRDARAASDAFESAADTDRKLLGDLYEGRATSATALTVASDWVAELRAACGVDGSVAMGTALAGILYEADADPELEASDRRWSQTSEGLVDLFRAERAVPLRAALQMGSDAARQALDLLGTDRGGPDEWRTYYEGRAVLDELGLGDLVDRAVRRSVAPDDFPRIVERAVLRAWADAQLSVDKRLATTRSVDRDGLVKRFQQLDAKLTDYARARVIQACDARRPRTVIDPGAVLIRREGEKKSRHKPVRELLDTARDTVRLIKPCFMMSPLTVSRFLPSDIDFDVVIFDEASQVLPQDAVNCVYRGRSLIVAGDQKQLPPTSFFSSTGDDEAEAEDDELPERFGSVLDMCKASGLLPSLSLRWHYRSRHEALIAFGNHEFYKESMITFPGAHAEGEDVGVAFFRAPEGVYRSGGAARDNPGEAAEVARRVIHHFTTRKGKSLGVVALSQPQAVAIQDAVDVARRSRSDLDDSFSEGRLDGFFVKNLESVQGDERDVMIMSVGYGADANGKFSMNFGPMNKPDGWRRLNVAATRARYRMEVIASFDPAELRETTSESFRYFQRYLRYAQSGLLALAQSVVDGDAQPESPFEESVLAVLRKLGYDVQPQVGVAGYRIDLGIRHPRLPGRFVLGVECDGAMYHSSKAARDRDRLREGVLRGLGWELHRIWGTDWYRDRAGAEARLRTAVESAIAHAAVPNPPVTRPIEHTTTPTPQGLVLSDVSVPAARSNRQPASGPARRRSPGREPVGRFGPGTATSVPRESFPITALASTSRQRLTHELTQIRAALAEPQLRVPRETDDSWRKREKRREQLEERAVFLQRILRAVPGAQRTSGGPVVAPGRLVGLIFDGTDDVEEYEITSQRPSVDDIQVLSPFTELGAALLWSEAGTRVEYTDGRGGRRRVRIRHVRD
jgi:transcription elongation GreA/GreB family factor/very-short-patch-repair endonuclease